MKQTNNDNNDNDNSSDNTTANDNNSPRRAVDNAEHAHALPRAQPEPHQACISKSINT